MQEPNRNENDATERDENVESMESAETHAVADFAGGERGSRKAKAAGLKIARRYTEPAQLLLQDLGAM